MVATTRRQLAGVGWVPRHPLPHGSLGRVAGHLSSGPGEEEEKKEEEAEEAAAAQSHSPAFAPEKLPEDKPTPRK